MLRIRLVWRGDKLNGVVRTNQEATGIENFHTVEYIRTFKHLYVLSLQIHLSLPANAPSPYIRSLS